MKFSRVFALTLSLAVAVAGGLFAHFQMIVPTTDFVGGDDPGKIDLALIFNHPMGGAVMNMEKPVGFGVVVEGEKKTDLLASLREAKQGEFKTWTAVYETREPGDHVFYVEPKPYWEPSEGKYVVHFTKIVVGVGEGSAWDRPIGLKAEILPLVRPYGLWAGNVFRGIVTMDGKPVPDAMIEVEYYNAPGAPVVKPPTDSHETQVIKANAAGEFSYAMPRAGWWGFAALMDGDKIDGKDCEIGAVFWVKTYEMK